MKNSSGIKENMYSHLMKQGTELLFQADTKEKENLQKIKSNRWKSMHLYLKRCACALAISR